MNSGQLTPSVAIRLLQKVTTQPGVNIAPAYVANDLANLRRAHPSDDDYAAAIVAVAREISREKFASRPSGPANLRLVIRPRDDGGMDIVAFGERHFPQSVYLTAKERQQRER